MISNDGRSFFMCAQHGNWETIKKELLAGTYKPYNTSAGLKSRNLTVACGYYSLADKAGAPKDKAYEWGNSLKSYWRIPKSPIIHGDLGNSYWSSLGLKSLL
jgi:hypothetical protein